MLKADEEEKHWICKEGDLPGREFCWEGWEWQVRKLLRDQLEALPITRLKANADVRGARNVKA